MGLIENAGIGIGTGIINNAMQLGQQQDLNSMQIQGSKELAKYNSDLAYEMWEKTNYEAQRKQMEKAGLNVGLIYSKGSGGGGTTSAGAGGSISGGQASAKSITDGMGINLQSAQIENIKADTAKKEAEKNEVEARTPTYAKGIEKTDAEIEEIATRLGVNVEQAKKIIQEVEKSKSDVKVNEANIINTVANTRNTEANTNRTEIITPIEAQKGIEEIKNMVIKNSYLDRKEEAELNNLITTGQKLAKEMQQNDERLDIETFKKELEAQYPNIFNVAGRTIDSVINKILDMTGYRNNDEGDKRRVIKR